MSVNYPRSPDWNTSTKIFVAAFTLVLIGLAVGYFQALIAPLVIAGILAYILNPLIAGLDQHTPLGRGVAIGLVYGLFLLIMLGLLTAAGVTIYQQVDGLLAIFQNIIRSGPEPFEEFLSQPIQFGAWTIHLDELDLDLSLVWQQLASAIQPIMSQSAQFVGLAATMTVSWVGWTIVVFVLSIYFVVDLPRFGKLISDSIYQPGYRRDVERLLSETGRIWNGYLRGQTILAVIVGTAFTIVLTALGVRYALVLGILAGVLDFIPFVGPFIIVTLSTIVAIFQGGNWMGLSPIWFGVVVLLAGLIMQQIEGNWLNPRIVGGAINLHPLLVMIGAIMGSALAGVLGVMLAAPVMATVKLLGTYAWRKMFDLDPFPEPEPAAELASIPRPALSYRQILRQYIQRFIRFRQSKQGRL